MRDPEVGDRIDQYHLTELLARGGMASIFKAIDSESGAAVVLKIIAGLASLVRLSQRAVATRSPPSARSR